MWRFDEEEYIGVFTRISPHEILTNYKGTVATPQWRTWQKQMWPGTQVSIPSSGRRYSLLMCCTEKSRASFLHCSCQEGKAESEATLAGPSQVSSWWMKVCVLEACQGHGAREGRGSSCRMRENNETRVFLQSNEEEGALLGPLEKFK